MFQRRFRAAFGREPLPVVSISTENRVDTSPPAPRWGAAERLRRTALFSSQEGGRKEKAARQHRANEQACRAGRAGALPNLLPPGLVQVGEGELFLPGAQFLGIFVQGFGFFLDGFGSLVRETSELDSLLQLLVKTSKIL